MFPDEEIPYFRIWVGPYFSSEQSWLFTEKMHIIGKQSGTVRKASQPRYLKKITKQALYFLKDIA